LWNTKNNGREGKIMDFRTRFAVWVDDHPRMVCTPEYFDRAVEIGYDQLRIMVDSSDSSWDKRFSLDQLEEVCKLAVVERDLSIVVVHWPVPHLETIEDMIDDLSEMIAASGASAISAEIEGLMMEHVARDLGWNILDAKKYLFDMMLELKDKHDITAEITTHPSHPEAMEPDDNRPSRGFLASRVDRVMWQIYATRHDWKKNLVPWGGRYGPIGRKSDVDRLTDLSIRYGKRPCFGTAAWDQKWPGHTVEEALEVSSSILLEKNPDIVSDWMSGNTIGRFRNKGNNPKIIEFRKKLISKVKQSFNG
jgi:hypothetical protein